MVCPRCHRRLPVARCADADFTACICCKIEDIERRRRVELLTYAQFIHSPEWAAIRKCALEHAAFRCQRCGARAYEVHHLHYDKPWGSEEVGEDIEALCKPCHEKADAERRADVAGERWRRRVEGWIWDQRRRGVYDGRWWMAERELEEYLEEHGDDEDEEWWDRHAH